MCTDIDVRGGGSIDWVRGKDIACKFRYLGGFSQIPYTPFKNLLGNFENEKVFISDITSSIIVIGDMTACCR